TVPWYLFAFLAGRDAFVSRQLIFENIARFLGGEHVNSEPFWFYLESMVSKAAPWSLLFALFLVGSTFRCRNYSVRLIEHGSKAQIQNMLLIWFFSGFVFLSM